MFLFDRIYGELVFPPLIKEVLGCPGLLRLRSVRMPNVPFFSFPSFAAVTRYEHSLGVCHLADIFAKKAGLPEKDRIEIMLAALYHDAATPPFAHAVEEVLDELYGFDHESKLRQLINGGANEIGQQRLQLFMGRSLKLHSVCQRASARKLGIDTFRIAQLATGAGSDPLSGLVCSKGIDLDNIDNVMRSATAMGINDWDPLIAETLAASFIINGDKTAIDEAASREISSWKNARQTLYGMIFASIEDFALQTMLKDAICYLRDAHEDITFQASDWLLTDSDLVYNRLLKHPPSAEIVKRMRLGEFYTCLSYLSLEGERLLNGLKEIVKQIEGFAYKNDSEYPTPLFDLSPSGNPQKSVVVNYYIDKRERSINKTVMFFGREKEFCEHKYVPRVFVGVFTPQQKKWNSRSQNNFMQMVRDYLKDVEVRPVKSIYGKYPSVE